MSRSNRKHKKRNTYFKTHYILTYNNYVLTMHILIRIESTDNVSK